MCVSSGRLLNLSTVEHNLSSIGSNPSKVWSREVATSLGVLEGLQSLAADFSDNPFSFWQKKKTESIFFYLRVRNTEKWLKIVFFFEGYASEIWVLLNWDHGNQIASNQLGSVDPLPWHILFQLNKTDISTCSVDGYVSQNNWDFRNRGIRWGRGAIKHSWW